jgi:hypothetical protein
VSGVGLHGGHLAESRAERMDGRKLEWKPGRMTEISVGSDGAAAEARNDIDAPSCAGCSSYRANCRRISLLGAP